jgi:lipoprotein-anchoring transpeptidase ErfK/SrfK
LKVTPGENGPAVTLDAQAVTSTLAQMSEALGPERWIDAPAIGPSFAQAVQEGSSFTAIVHHHPTTYIVESGDTLLKIGWKVGMPFWMIQEANPGLDPENLWAGEQLTIPSKDELLPLPVVMNKRIVISISEQRLWAYQDGQLAARHVISTGIDRSPTQPGTFQVQTHDPNAYASVWDLNMPNFLGIYEAWPGFMNGIHGLPTLSNGRRLWANILGRPASYGCIILDLDAAEWLYSWAEDGVVVEIQG